MKRIALPIAIVGIMAAIGFGFSAVSTHTGGIQTETIFDGSSLAIGTHDSDVFELNKMKPGGFFSLQIKITEAGTAQIQYLCSNTGGDADNFVVPEGGTDIVTAMTAGTKHGAFLPPLCKYVKIRVIITDDTVDPTITMAIQ